MSNYTKTTDFEAKDSLPTGDSGKIIRGAEFETEFDAIATAITTKADTAGPTFTGTLTFETISDGTIGVTAFVDEDDMSSDSATLVPTQQSVKAYVDSVTTELQAQDLDFQADSGGALNIDLDTETMTFTGGTGIDTSGSGNTVTFDIDSTVATLTGTQTLTNKTLTAPTISGNLTTDGTIDGRDVATDGAKLDGIEAGATADQTAAEIRTLVDSATDSNVFTDADHTKLDGIEASATADQTDAEIRAAVEAATDSNVFTDADHTKLDGIEANATADQTDAEIRAAVEAATDSNVFTDADHTKLDGIEALADVTDTTNVTAAGALMDSELTNLTAVKSLDQGVATTDSPTFAGLTTTADVSFGDNDKAIFGAGSDLQIYHDGSNSYVQDTGDGDLILQGTNVQLRSNNTMRVLQGVQGAETKIFYNNAQKLSTTSTGIDVTGTVTADGLTVDAGSTSLVGTFQTTASNSSLVYADSSQTLILKNDDANGTARLKFLGTASESGAITFGSGVGATSDTFAVYPRVMAGGKAFNITGGGDISFYEDTGTTAKLFWDASAESLGIGTSSPAAPLDIKLNTNSTADIFKFQRNDGAVAGVLNYSGTDGAISLGTTTSHDFTFDTAGTERMRIDSSGNVGIGTTSPQLKLAVSNAGAQGFEVNPLSTIVSGGVDVISYNRSANAYSPFNWDGSYHVWSTSNTERMRIDSSGNLLVGTTELSLYSETSGGETGWAFRPDGRLYNSRDNGTNAVFNRLTSDGDIVQFRKDGTSVGSIGTTAGYCYYNGSASGIDFYGVNALPTSGGTNVAADAVTSLGNDSFRWKDLYLSNGINLGGNSAEILEARTETGFVKLTASHSGGGSNSAGFIFRTRNGTAGTNEKMRLTKEGNLLVGTTSTNPAGGTGVGIQLNPIGQVNTSRSGGASGVFNRTTSDGEIIQLKKEGTTVGSIGVENSDRLYIDSGSGNTGIRFDGGAWIPRDNGVVADNVVDLGATSARFDDIYATNGTIQTSDRNEKQDIEALSDAEQRVAVAAKGLLRKFRWIDSVADKGDDARIHFGIIAQDLQDAFTAEGLDAGRYAMFISTTWTDEETSEERTRMGVRYSELLAFIIAAI